MPDPEPPCRELQGVRIDQNHRQRSTGILMRPAGFSISNTVLTCQGWRSEENAGFCRISEPQPFRGWAGHTDLPPGGRRAKLTV